MSEHEYVFQPHVGIGPLRFGMSVSEAHELCGPPAWRRGPDEFFGSTREHFESRGLCLQFGRDGRLRSVELYPQTRVMLDRINLMVPSYRDLVNILRIHGVSVAEEGDGFRCDALGLAAYAPELDVPVLSDAPLESLLVYERGYYDEMDVRFAG